MAWLCLLVIPTPSPAQTESGPGATTWQGDATSGPVVHRASQVTFPAELESFRRTDIRAVSADDVSAGYRATDGNAEIRASVYLFRPGALPEHRLRGSMAAFATLSPEAFVWSTGPFDVAGRQRLHGYKGTFKTGVGPGTSLDYLYFFELGGWTVKVRATLSGTGQEMAHEARLDAFVRGLPWDQILAANGACTGRACTTPPTDTMINHFVQLRLPPLLPHLMRFDAEAEAALPAVARADLPLVGSQEVRRGNGQPLVYVMTLPSLGTFRLVRLPEPFTPLFTESFGRVSIERPIFALLQQINRHDFAPRFLHGEPTPEAFAAVVGELVPSIAPEPMLSVADAARAMPE
ncbi:MAG: hypothetical protein ACXWUN_11295 [Allosphingosinicella sp.]